ncbi:MAG TPA: flavin reductase family protein [Caulobacteraceae bacterium]|jgi:flavin reductase (DIM6/NTAB) family NADH-FMN oxidoreductase RutF
MPGPDGLPTAAFTPRQLRDAFGCFATGVTVLTTLDEGRPVGLTANSFTSVSLDPPLVLFCLDRRSTSLPAFERAEHLAVNVLHAGQEALSMRFSRREPDRFADTPWVPGRAGMPLLADAMAVFECRRESVEDAGDHRLFLARVEAVACDASYDPLVFFHGRYRSVHVPE